MIMVAITIIISISFGLTIKLLNAIPITIFLALAIIAGVFGIIFGIISLNQKRELFGFLGLIISILITLWDAFMMFVLHCDAWFSVP